MKSKLEPRSFIIFLWEFQQRTNLFWIDVLQNAWFGLWILLISS